METSHYHITINNSTIDEIKTAAKLIKGKVTEIDLIIGTDISKDRILTKYQKGRDVQQLFDDVKLLRSKGYVIDRYKLELMFDNFSDISNLKLNDFHYIECHIKVPNTFERRHYEMFALSSNRNNVDYYFYNGRCRDIKQLNNFIMTFDKIVLDASEFGNVDVHKEYTVYDSNPNHDRKWT